MGKELIILRGLPGSGKSTLARVLSDGCHPVFSIDDYFTSESGEYNFNFSENHKAYDYCESRTEQAMISGTGVIIIDNVFSLQWEMEPYFKLAKEHHYRVHVLTVENRHKGKNVHGIDEEQIRKIAAKYKVELF